MSVIKKDHIKIGVIHVIPPILKNHSVNGQAVINYWINLYVNRNYHQLVE
jgi:hypothetical protein